MTIYLYRHFLTPSGPDQYKWILFIKTIKHKHASTLKQNHTTMPLEAW